MFVADTISIIACRMGGLLRRNARMRLPPTRDECDDGNDDRKNAKLDKFYGFHVLRRSL